MGGYRPSRVFVSALDRVLVGSPVGSGKLQSALASCVFRCFFIFTFFLLHETVLPYVCCVLKRHV